MNRAEKRRRNRATGCCVCCLSMPMGDRVLYLGGVAHEACARADRERRDEQTRQQTLTWCERMERAAARIEARASAARVGLWVP